MRITLSTTLIGCLCSSAACLADEPLAAPGKSPQESLESIQVRDGFQVELVASEPLVRDPIAIAWGTDGKLWVVEMGDYPLGDGSGGRIRFLEATDGDGTFDRSTIFLSGLSAPTGVLPWGDGILVSCAPDIFYAEDTDGDGKADLRRVLFTGFYEGNPQHRVNGLRWGLDNWVHCANGDSGGIVRSIQTGDRLNILGHDFRIEPRSGRIELLTGMSQFGRCRDDWGNWFGGSADVPLWHSVLPHRYLRRNPYLKPPEPKVALTTPPANPPVFPISRPPVLTSQRTATNIVTSACGATIYRDELFGPEFAQSWFVCEPAHNLVHHEVLSADGATFSSRRPAAEQNQEFLASRDTWFRPTQVRTGPDGALWIVDMYRLVIEHPEWIAPKWRERVDLSAGEDKGRIYRVFPKGNRPGRIARLDRLDTPELVAVLDGPNGPRRDQVHQLLVQRQDMRAVEPLETLFARSQRASARLTALCTLDGLDALSAKLLTRALRDPHPAVRRHALRISERHSEESCSLQRAILDCATDSDPQVRLQLAFSLGERDDARAGHALARLAARHSRDPLLMAAVMSSAVKHPDAVLTEMFRDGQLQEAQVGFVNDLLRGAIDMDQEGTLALALREIAQPAGGQYRGWQFELLAGVFDNLDYAGTSLDELKQVAGAELRAAVEGLSELLERSRALASDERQAACARARAVRLLARIPDRKQQDLRLLRKLLTPQTPGEVQTAAVKVLGDLGGSEVPEILLENWAAHSPGLRKTILDVLLTRSEWTLHLLDRMESHEVSAGSLEAGTRAKLILHHSAEVRKRSAALLETPVDRDRRQPVEQYEDVVQRTGDPQRGEAIFAQHCASCHRLGGTGRNLGPDLRALTDRSRRSLLTAILDPNRKIDPRYETYHAVTRDGRILTGILTSESGESITLTDPNGNQHVLLRSELDVLRGTGRSLMPEGLEKLIPALADLADLIAFVRQASGEE